MISYHATPLRGVYLAGRTFICRRCGIPFAQVSTGSEFIPCGGICESCTMAEWVPGSILDSLRPDFNRSLPLEAWLREVELHCRWAERGD